MEVIGHKHKFMQQIFALPAVVLQNFNEELRHSLRLKQAPLLKRGSGDEVDGVSFVAAGRSSHKAPQRLQPLYAGTLSQRWKRSATAERKHSARLTSRDALPPSRQPH